MRAIDDSSRTGSGVNLASCAQERLTLPTTDVNVSLIRDLRQALPGDEFGARVLDEKAALRQVAVCRDHHAFAVIALRRPDGAIAFFVMVGHAFGLTAAVCNYNRRAAVINDWLLKLGLLANCYYDDKFGFS